MNPSSSLVAPAAGSQPNGALRLNLFISGTYAWLTTTAVPALMDARLAPLLAAFAAFAALAGGLLLYAHRPGWGRSLGMVTFIALCTLCWIALGDALGPTRLHPLQAASGAVGWMLFAFSWGNVRNVRAVPEHDPRVVLGKPLAPRTALPRRAYVVFAISLLGGLVPWLLAWRVERATHAMLAHAAGLISAVAMISLGAEVALGLGRENTSRSTGARLNAVSNTAAALVIVGIIGLVVWLVRG
jgi:hypothetical protein